MRYLKLVSLILLGSVAGFTSCSKDDEVPSGNAYTLKVSKNYPEYFEFVAFITNENGEVMDKGKIKPGKTLRLYAPENYTGQVDFHYASQATLTSAFNYSVYTTPDVPAGWETNLTAADPLAFPSQSHSLDVSGISVDYDLMRHAGPTVWQRTSYVLNEPNSSQLFFSSFETGPITYVLQKLNSQSPRYLHIPEPVIGETFEADFTDFMPAEAVNLTIGVQADQIIAGISALFPQGKTSPLGTSTLTDTDNIDLYYYPEEIFPAYVTYLEVDREGLRHTYRKYGDRVSSMHWLEAEINALEISGNTLTATTTGAYDQFYVFSETQWEIGDTYYSVFWRINMKEEPGQSIVLPNVIQVLENYWDNAGGITLTPESGELTSSTVQNFRGETRSVSRSVDGI